MKVFNLYIADGCHNCHDLMEKMDKYGIQYTVLNVSTNRKAAKHMFKELKIKSVPLVEYEDQFMLGNDPNLNKFLGIEESVSE